MTKLTLDDISDLRAYERERDEFKAHVIALKKRRRVGIGPIITLVFENRDTIRFQIQEMARVEKIISDEGIQGELDAYNSLIPEAGQLSATLFIELTSEEMLREWLPNLVGIERSVAVELGNGDDAERIACIPEEAHEALLTRDEITASVHYIRFELTSEQIQRVAAGDQMTLHVALPAYTQHEVLNDETRAELLADLRGE